MAGGEAGAVEMRVGEVEWHGAALGDLLGFVQQAGGLGGIGAQRAVVERGGEEGFGEKGEFVGGAESGDSLGECGMRSAESSRISNAR